MYIDVYIDHYTYIDIDNNLFYLRYILLGCYTVHMYRTFKGH